MKRLVIFWGFLFLLFGEAKAQEKLFQAANQAYREGNYTQAVDLYDSIQKTGFESAALYFNLGNAHYQNGALARAILNYERAKLLAPEDGEIDHNLKLAEQKRVDRFEPMPPNLFKAFRLGVIRLFKPDSWGLISIIFLGIALTGLGFYLFSSYGRLGFISLIGGILLSGFCLLMAFSHYNYQKEHPQLIVMSDSAYAKSGPGSAAEDLFILHAGTKVEKVDEFESWLKLRLIDGKIGWLPESDLERIR